MKKNIIIILIITIIVYLDYKGIIWHNELFAHWYPVKGLDISHHQGDIKWDKIDSRNYQFVFIKATEGTTFIDDQFQKNWRESKKRRFLRGAYHFFSFITAGQEQADYFMHCVSQDMGELPPVLDIEINDTVHVSDVSKIRDNIQQFLNRIEKVWNVKPILYVTNESYNLLIKNQFDTYNIWIRSIFTPPIFLKNKKWAFWQYSNRGHINGISTYTDKNVFYGSLDQLKKLSSPTF